MSQELSCAIMMEIIWQVWSILFVNFFYYEYRKGKIIVDARMIIIHRQKKYSLLGTMIVRDLSIDNWDELKM